MSAIAAAVLPDVSLDTWRRVAELGREARQAEAMDERIALCREFVARHPSHSVTSPFIGTLAEALAATGRAKPRELEQLVKKRIELEPADHALPAELVRQYWLRARIRGRAQADSRGPGPTPEEEDLHRLPGAGLER